MQILLNILFISFMIFYFVKNKTKINNIEYYADNEYNLNLMNNFKYDDPSGFDIASPIDIDIRPGDRALIPTGIRFSLPHGVELQIRPRSGYTDKTGGVVILGTIDPDYRGVIHVNIFNFGKKTLHIKKGERIAQGVFVKLWFNNKTDRLIRKDFIKNGDKNWITNRGNKGIGSTDF